MSSPFFRTVEDSKANFALDTNERIRTKIGMTVPSTFKCILTKNGRMILSTDIQNTHFHYRHVRSISFAKENEKWILTLEHIT